MKVINTFDIESLIKVKDEIDSLYKSQDPNYNVKCLEDFVTDTIYGNPHCYVKNDEVTPYGILEVDKDHTYLFVTEMKHIDSILERLEGIRNGKLKTTKKSTVDIYKDGIGPNLYKEYFLFEGEVSVISEN